MVLVLVPRYPPLGHCVRGPVAWLELPFVCSGSLCESALLLLPLSLPEPPHSLLGSVLSLSDAVPIQSCLRKLIISWAELVQ